MDLQTSTPSPVSSPTLNFNDLCQDIALEIFLHAVEEDGVTMYMNRGPWLLGRVCSCWRQLVNMSPSLWRIIDFSFSPNYRREVSGLSALLDALLSRSLKMSLHITFKYYCTIDAQSALVLKRLLLCSERWQTADLQLIPDMLPDLAELPAPGPAFPILSHLQLELYIHDDDPPVLPVTLFHDTPMLHTVDFEGVSAEHLKLLSLNWDSVKVLTNIADGDMLSESRILQSALNLTSYSAQHCFRSPIPPPGSKGSAVLRLMHLQDLTLWGEAVGDMQYMRFDLPGLRDVHIDVGHDPTVVSLDCLLPLIVPMCAIRSLVLNGILLAFGAQLMTILEQLDGTLEVLHLRHRGIRCGKEASSSSRNFIPAFVDALTNTPKKNCFLPRLQDLRFDIHSSNVELDMEWGHIGRMWVSRRQAEYGDRCALGVARLEEMYFADRRCVMRNGVLSVTPVQQGVEITDDCDALDVGDLYAEF